MTSIVPTLHGSGLELLISGRINAITSLQTAQEALRQITPHGRDYPDAEALAEARSVHAERLATLAGLIDDLTNEGLAIQRRFEGED